MAVEQEVQSGIAILGSEAKAAIQDMYHGPAMQKLKIQRISSYEAIEAQGQIKPAMVMNFNPIPLKLCESIVPWTVPACNDRSVPKSLRFTLEFEGKKYTASLMPIEKAQFVPWLRDVKPPQFEGGEPTPDYDPKWILPLELADQYNLEYNDPQRQNVMGGVLVFEGDIHSFRKSQGKTIRVPKFKTLSDRTRSYYTEEVNVFDVLKKILTAQRARCEDEIQRGDEFNQDDSTRKNICPPMRAWAQYALDMGWKQNPPPWLNNRLDSEEACKGCGKGRTNSSAWACACGRFYDPLAAYLAGEDVPPAYLVSLKGDDLTAATKEYQRRQKVLAMFGGATPAKTTEVPAL